jgi:pyrroline-5-carboxylate reductase
MAAAPGSLLLVGCGNMGRALLAGWLARGTPLDSVTVIEPGPDQATAARELGVRVLADAGDLAADYRPAVVLLAVKPQMMDAVAPAYARFAGSACFLSIAAGKTLAALRRALGSAAIVRTMPNTPAAVARGITVAVPNAAVTPAMRTVCTGLLEAVGEVVWVEDETLLDAVTAVSGSGPAYVFLLIEAMAQAGVVAGLPPDLAARLARATVAGSGELVARLPEDPAQLRRNVTSPGGTTQAALEVLMAPDGLAALLTRAVAAATRRSRELAS